MGRGTGRIEEMVSIRPIETGVGVYDVHEGIVPTGLSPPMPVLALGGSSGTYKDIIKGRIAATGTGPCAP